MFGRFLISPPCRPFLLFCTMVPPRCGGHKGLKIPNLVSPAPACSLTMNINWGGCGSEASAR